MTNKLAKLVLLIHLIEVSLSNQLTSYLSTLNSTSTLIVTNKYDCRYYYTKKTVFAGIQQIIDYLIEDYTNKDGKLSKKPTTIIMQLKLYNSKGTNVCYVSQDMTLYNPFVLGKHNPNYKVERNKYDPKCCLDLENTYDL